MVEQVEKRTAEGGLLGEITMPERASIDLTRVSHQVTELRVEDGWVVGKIKVLNTPGGQALKSLLDGKVDLNFAPRGMGYVDGNGLVTNYQLISIDVVQAIHPPEKEVKNALESVIDVLSRGAW